MHDAIVIGAGFGGLTAAIALAARGRSVLVVEAAEEPGGKAGVARIGGVEVDTGPSVLTMPDVFEEIFALAGSSLAQEVTLRRPDPGFRYLYADGVALDVHHELGDTLESVRKTLGAKAAGELEAFLAYAARIWDAAAPVFVYGDAPNVRNVLSHGLGALARMATVDPWSRMGAAIHERVSSPHLRMLLARYATYNGSDVRTAPATLNCIAHVELALGGFGVAGGMHELVRALVRVAGRLGVEWAFGTPVARVAIEGRVVRGVTTRDGTLLPARGVVCNADAAHLIDDLLGPDVPHGLPRGEGRSMSAVNAIVRALRGPARVAHTVLFPEDYEAEFADIFDRGRAPVAPTVYLCAQEACHGRRGFPDHEPVFVMANAPAASDAEAEADAALLERTIARARRAGLFRDDDEVVWKRTPRDLAARFPGSGGAIYGAASNGPSAAFQRPPNRVPKLRGLYLASGSAHPGGGVPLAALSGRAAARALLKDQP